MNANAVILLKARLCHSASIHLWYRALFTIYRCDWHMNVICWDVQIPRQICMVCGRGSKDYQLSYRSSTWKTQPFFHVQDYSATMEIKGYHAQLFYYCTEFINKRCLKFLY